MRCWAKCQRDADVSLQVSVVLALPERYMSVQITIADDCSARQAVLKAVDAGLDCAKAGINPLAVPIGVFGERVNDDAMLSDGDRVELYRPLHQDPKELRRQRAVQAPEPGKRV